MIRSRCCCRSRRRARGVSWNPDFFTCRSTSMPKIGLVVLIAMAAKNGILIVEFAKAGARKAGHPGSRGARARMRFRAVMMTSFAFILGVYPLVVHKVQPRSSRHDVGTPVFAGMIAPVGRDFRDPDALRHLPEHSRAQQRTLPAPKASPERNRLAAVQQHQP